MWLLQPIFSHRGSAIKLGAAVGDAGHEEANAREARRLRARRHAAASALSGQAWAGNEANFVLYDHHTDAKGETEINVFSDFSNAVGDEPRYSAQLFEIERALTDRWEAALYLEGDKIDGEDYRFGGWRLESRYRLFDYGAFLNPVLYVEYENLEAGSQVSLGCHGTHRYARGPRDDGARDREQAHRRPRHYEQAGCRLQLDQ